MQKFLSIPIAGSTPQLIAINDVVNVRLTTTQKLNLTYSSGKIATLAIGSVMSATDVTLRDRIQDDLIEALQTSWVKPRFEVSLAGLTDAAGAAVTITGITVA